MSSPCGKCDACPCPGRPTPQEVEQEQKQAKPKKPRVECRCVPNKERRSAQVQPPLADAYTCLRAREEPVKPQQPMCTCKQEVAPPRCECEPAAAPPSAQKETRVQAAPSKPPTHAYITCGTPTNTNVYYDPKSCAGYKKKEEEQPRYVKNENKKKGAQCPHCEAPKKKKKCVIQ